MALALTASTAIGGVALRSSANRDVLLVLPFVLSGLAFVYLDNSIHIHKSGRYLRNELWPTLAQVSTHPANSETPIPSWEKWIADDRHERGRLSPSGIVAFLGEAIVFGVPAVGALAITIRNAWSHSLEPIWWPGLLTLLSTAAIAVVVERQELSRADQNGELVQ